jgi:hypothetical protein
MLLSVSSALFCKAKELPSDSVPALMVVVPL